jgi:hypothetical protein
MLDGNMCAVNRCPAGGTRGDYCLLVRFAIRGQLKCSRMRITALSFT